MAELYSQASLTKIPEAVFAIRARKARRNRVGRDSRIDIGDF